MLPKSYVTSVTSVTGVSNVTMLLILKVFILVTPQSLMLGGKCYECCWCYM